MPRQQLSTRIDRNLYLEFKEAVEKKHGKIHGILGIEVERAMRNHIKAGMPEKYKRPYSKRLLRDDGTPDPANPNYTKFRRDEKLQKDFKLACKDAKKISSGELSKLIKKSLDIVDDRTVDRYVGKLVRWGYISNIGFGVWENHFHFPPK